MFGHLLVPVDGSEHSDRAVDIAGDLAQRYGATLTLMHVLPHAGRDRVPRELESFAEIERVRVTEHDLIERAGNQILERAKRRAAEAGMAQCETILDHGDAATCIADRAVNKRVDLIVMGRRGFGDLAGLMLGSVSHKVSQATNCSCLTVM